MGIWRSLVGKEKRQDFKRGVDIRFGLQGCLRQMKQLYSAAVKSKKDATSTKVIPLNALQVYRTALS